MSCALGASMTVSANPVITDFSIDGGTMTFVVEGLESGQQARIQQNSQLLPGTWPELTGATITANGGGTFTVTAARPADEKAFFRAIGQNLGSATDLDGDGLPNAFETDVLGTNPNLFDSDNDGFSDGTEYGLGTDANLASSFPDLAALPAVEFEASLSQAIEGVGTHAIPLKSSTSFTGTVGYSISARSTASSPEDYIISSGSVSMVSGSAEIPVTIIDDLEISPERLLIIDLDKNVPGNAYRAAGAVTHVVCLGENDSYWDGVVIDNTTQRNFRMRLLRNGGTTQWAFVSGSSDGLPVATEGGADISATSQTTGLVPTTNLDGDAQEVFVATPSIFSPSSMLAFSPEMPVRSGGFTGTTPMKQVLQLNATHGPIEQPVGSGNFAETPVLRGSYVQTLSHATDPSITYLDAVITGEFVLSRETTRPAEIDSAYSIAP